MANSLIGTTTLNNANIGNLKVDNDIKTTNISVTNNSEVTGNLKVGDTIQANKLIIGSLEIY